MNTTIIYQNVVSSLILICLLILIFQNHYLSPTSSVPNIKQTGQAISVAHKNTNFGLIPLNEDGSINVRIMESVSPMKVSIEDINTWDELHVEITGIDTNDELETTIESISSFAFFHTAPIRVKVEE